MKSKQETFILMGQAQQDELHILLGDKVLQTMLSFVPLDVDLETISFKQVNETYKRLGGKHNPLTIGSLKRALIQMRQEGE